MCYDVFVSECNFALVIIKQQRQLRYAFCYLEIMNIFNYKKPPTVTKQTATVLDKKNKLKKHFIVRFDTCTEEKFALIYYIITQIQLKVFCLTSNLLFKY